jgi:hypothetical protein
MTAWAALREDRKRTPEQRQMIIDHLTAHPGLTAGELSRTVLRGVTDAGVLLLCRRMERDGQLTSATAHDSQQGRNVTRWHALL